MCENSRARINFTQTGRDSKLHIKLAPKSTEIKPAPKNKNMNLNSGSDSFHNLLSLYAARANPESFYLPLDKDTDILKVRVPSPFGSIVCVTDLITNPRTLATYFTSF